MPGNPLHILVADDDQDDHMLLREAFNEIPITSSLTNVKNGEQLMTYLLENTEPLTDVLFLDLNMPLKSGLECLAEIKENIRYQKTWIIILSTIANKDIIELVYQKGAHYFIQKPTDFSILKRTLHDLLKIAKDKIAMQPAKHEFLLTKDEN